MHHTPLFKSSEMSAIVRIECYSRGRGHTPPFDPSKENLRFKGGIRPPFDPLCKRRGVGRPLHPSSLYID